MITTPQKLYDTRTVADRQAARPPLVTSPALPSLQVGTDSDAGDDRRRRAAGLVAIAGRSREELERLRGTFVRRLHLRSDDYAATEGLRTAEMALTLLPR